MPMVSETASKLNNIPDHPKHPINLIWLLFVLPLVLILLLTEYWVHEEEQNGLKLIAHTQEVKVALAKVLSTMQDAETGQRGFLLTDQEHYLKPFIDATKNLESSLSSLQHLTIDNPVQRSLLVKVKTLSTKNISELRKTISLSRNQKKDEALKLVKSDQGKNLMDNVRLIIKKMENEEQVLLSRRELKTNKVHVIGNYIRVIFSLIFLTIVFIVIFRLRLESSTLKKQVDRRTIELAQKVRELNFQKQALDEHAIVSITNVKGEIIYVNEKFSDITGYSREELLGDNHRILKSDEHSPEFYSNMWKTISNGNIWKGEIKNKTKFGGYYWVNSTIVPSLDINGKPFQYVSIRTDITKRKQIEYQLTDARKQSEAANIAKSEFLANMSHEIRTPLNAILGFSEILSEQIVDAKQKKFINNINTAGTSLLALINSILDLSKIEAGKVELKLEPTSVRELFGEITSIFEGEREQKGVVFSVTVDSSVPDYLLLDVDHLRQILLNFCSNACKFTNEGQVSIRAEAFNKYESSGLVDLKLHIVDTGKGVAKDDFERIFKPFEQSDGQKISEYGGTGLGLAITQKFVEMMAGKIELESELGKGSHFTITLHGVEVVSNYSRKGQRLDLNYEAIDFAPAKLLVVDDITYNRELIINYLEHWPFTISQADNGLKALELCKSEHFDLILLDMKMPVMDGYEMSQRLRSNPKIADIPIIAITASALKHENDRILEHCDLYLAKPLDKAILVKSLMKILKHEQGETRIIKSTESQVKEQSDGSDLLVAMEKKSGLSTNDEDKNKTILVVDDGAMNRELFQEILKNAGYSVIEACDGVEGLAMINQHNPVLTLLDQNMPVMNGLEMLRQLNNTARPLPKVLLMSADGSNALGNKFIQLGACGIISKPFTTKELLEKISETLVNH